VIDLKPKAIDVPRVPGVLSPIVVRCCTYV